MAELLKNVRVLGAAVAAIGLLVAGGVYVPNEAGTAALTGLVAACGSGAVAAVALFVAKKRGGPPAAPGGAE